MKLIKMQEGVICEHYKNSMDAYRDLFMKAGLPQLNKFIKNGLIINASNSLTPETKENESYYLMSEIILDRFELKTGDDIFLVSGEFRKYIDEKNIEAIPKEEE